MFNILAPLVWFGVRNGIRPAKKPALTISRCVLEAFGGPSLACGNNNKNRQIEQREAHAVAQKR